MAEFNPTIREILINDAPLNAPNQLNKETKELLYRLQRKRINKPIIYIGMGTCGIVAGAGKTLKAIHEFLEENTIDAEVVETGCIGMCSSEPIVDIQLPGKARISYAKVTHDKIYQLLEGVLNHIHTYDDIIGQYSNEFHQPWEKVTDIKQIPFFARQNKIVTELCGIINPINIEEYIVYDGYRSFIKTLRNYTSKELCDIIELSMLRGRGGGGFITGKKWKIALESQANQKYLICNADESDPGAFMDRAIMEGCPHRLIEGIAIASYAIGATKALIYIRSEYSIAIKRLKAAIAEAYEYGLLGHNILNSGNNIDISIQLGAGAFVCGEETALLNSIEGKRGTARPKPPYPAKSGLFEMPTVINNVETLTNVPKIIDKGANWFKSIGTEESKGTKVFALSGKTIISGLIEVPMGTSIRTIIYDIADGIKNHNSFKAVLLGGPSGCLITKEQLDLLIDYESLAKVGAIMGSGGMVVMDENTCMVDIAKYLISFLQKESCGKCIPCREGTQRILEILENVTRRPDKSSTQQTLERFKGITELESLAEVIRDTSLCGLGQTAANPILSTLTHFKEEYEEHIFDRKCRAGVCKDLRAYYINVDKCIGCTMCSRKCPVAAIIGTPKSPHFIIEDKCIGCGMCYNSCKFGAVTVK